MTPKRLTIQARREKAKELVDQGLSQRQAAKALGIAHTTVQRDLAEEDVPEGGTKRATMAERRAMREIELAAKQRAL